MNLLKNIEADLDVNVQTVNEARRNTLNLMRWRVMKGMESHRLLGIINSKIEQNTAFIFKVSSLKK